MHHLTTEFSPQKVTGYKWVWGIIVGIITMSYYPLVGIIFFSVGLIMSAKILNSPGNKSGRLFNKGLHVYKKGFKDMSIQLWEEALKKDPNNLFAHRGLCIAYYDYAKKPSLALEHGKRVLEMDAADTRIVYKVGEFLYNLEEFDQAITILQSINPQGELSEERAKLLKRVKARKKG